MSKVDMIVDKAVKQHEDFLKMVRTIELRRLDELDGRKTIVTIQDRPVVDTFGRVSDDTTIVFKNEQSANYYLMCGSFVLVDVKEEKDKVWITVKGA